ncbi:hypothetical protein [Desulfobulbus sp.]|uniref:hypothetical protein n=1 Tax=Desulfobulbus sp. TaxID=895 RepID=UPI00286F2E06|nr:hypothetical protein [Desulfobulbus sp.]
MMTIGSANAGAAKKTVEIVNAPIALATVLNMIFLLVLLFDLLCPSSSVLLLQAGSRHFAFCPINRFSKIKTSGTIMDNHLEFRSNPTDIYRLVDPNRRISANPTRNTRGNPPNFQAA